MVGASALTPQLFMTPLIKRIRNVPGFVYKVMLLFRPLPLIMFPVLLLSENNFLTVVICSGAAMRLLLWAGLIFSAEPYQWKTGEGCMGTNSSFRGWRDCLLDLLSNQILYSDMLAFKHKFIIIFGLGEIFMFLSSLSMMWVKDVPRKLVNEKSNILQYVYNLPKFLGSDCGFRRLMTIQTLFTIGGVSLPYLIIFEKRDLFMSAEQVSALIFTQVIGSMLGGFLWET